MNFNARYKICPLCQGSDGQAYLKNAINCPFCGGEGIVFRKRTYFINEFIKVFYSNQIKQP